MKIAVAKEIDASEPRVAASPDTVKKFKALGAEVAVEPGAGVKSGLPDSEFTAAGATVSADALKDADIIIKVKRPEASELGEVQARRAGHRDHGSLWQRGRAEDDGRCRRLRLRDGADAAHHPRPGDGRAVLAGQSRRLPRGDRGRRGVRPRLPDDDDRGRHHPGRQGVRDGRRRRRPAGDRDRAAAGRHRHRDRRAARDQGAGRSARRQIPRRRGRGVQERADRRRLRQGDVQGVPGQAGRADRRAHQEAGHRHHHRADPGPSGAEAGQRPRW